VNSFIAGGPDVRARYRPRRVIVRRFVYVHPSVWRAQEAATRRSARFSDRRHRLGATFERVVAPVGDASRCRANYARFSALRFRSGLLLPTAIGAIFFWLLL